MIDSTFHSHDLNASLFAFRKLSESFMLVQHLVFIAFFIQSFIGFKFLYKMSAWLDQLSGWNLVLSASLVFYAL